MQRQVDIEEAMARSLPLPLAIAIVKDPAGKYNPISVAWAMNTSKEPPMLAISIGRMRYSFEGLEANKQFVVAFPSSTMAGDTVFFGTHSGRDMDKLSYYGTATEPAIRIDGVLLRDAVVNFECEVAGKIDSGDHRIYIGKILLAHVHQDPDVKRLYAIEPDRLGTVKVDEEYSSPRAK
ncbi:flavin reductase family protein [bacterium]|nr:flavin reductase family protein [bacterium]